MNPDRYLEEKAIAAQSPKASTATRKQNAWSAARAKGAQAVPAYVAAPLDQQQPDFGPPQSPFDAPDVTAPLSLSTPPRVSNAGNRGMVLGLNEDMRGTKFGRGTNREAQRNTYQSPEDYAAHQEQVMNSPLMKGLQEGADRSNELLKAYLENAPVATDLSPVMALADYMAKGKGTAASGYHRPQNFNEMVQNISGLMEANQKNRMGIAQLTGEQTGGLKSGAETAGTKSELSQEAQQGSKEAPAHVPMINPFTMAQSYGKDYAANPTVKEANDEVKAANETQQLLNTPNWLTNAGLKGMIIKGMGVNRITENEIKIYGGGSPDLWNRATIAIDRLTTGQTLSQSDLHTIQEFNTARLRAALGKRDEINKSFQQGLGQFTPFSPGTLGALQHAQDVQPLSPPPSAADEAARADQRHKELLDMMRNMK